MQVGAPLLMKSYNDELEFFFGDAHIPPPQSNHTPNWTRKRKDSHGDGVTVVERGHTLKIQKRICHLTLELRRA